MLQAKERFSRYLQRRYGDRSTPKHYLSDLQRFIQHVGTIPPQHITAEDIDQFVEQQVAEGLQPATINRRLSTLHSFFEFLASDEPDKAGANPVNGQHHRIKQGQGIVKLFQRMKDRGIMLS